MIRRQWTDEGGQPGWLLIRQIDHARLAADIAAHWASGSSGLGLSDIVIAAISQHDDGWLDWDARPEIDGQGRPIAFDEMPSASAVQIWRKSIASVEPLGPLAQYMVAGHFCALLVRFGRVKSDGLSDPIAKQFHTEYTAKMKDWLTAWTAGSEQKAPFADEALRWLQFFDALSLWLCTRRQTQPEQMVAPSNGSLTFSPQSGTDTIHIAPWPLRQPRLQVQVVARIVPAKAYRSTQELADVPVRTVVLTWHLEPIA